MARQKYADADVLSQHLVDPSESPWLFSIYKEILKQWSHARIGTYYMYFDSENVLHMHFAERGSYLEKKGVLRKIPKGHLPSYLMFPAANVSDSLAGEAAEVLSKVGSKADPDDPRWSEITKILKSMNRRPCS